MVGGGGAGVSNKSHEDSNTYAATWQCHTMATHHKTSVEQLSFCLQKDVRVCARVCVVRECVCVAVVTVAPALVSNAKPDAEMQAARGERRETERDTERESKQDARQTASQEDIGASQSSGQTNQLCSHTHTHARTGTHACKHRTRRQTHS